MIDVYEITDSNNKFLYNVVVTDDFFNFLKWKKDNKYVMKHLGTFNLLESDLEKITDDISKVIKEISL